MESMSFMKHVCDFYIHETKHKHKIMTWKYWALDQQTEFFFKSALLNKATGETNHNAINPPARLGLHPVVQNATGKTLKTHYSSWENTLSFISWSVNVERQENWK